MNEEEVKIKIVLPWLSQLGVSTTDLRLETSFSVRVGRQNCSVNSVESSVRARLDILVQRQGRNLAIIEVKRAEAKLTAADRDQAISYARLVQPIAPIAVITNGTEFEIYDALTQERLHSGAPFTREPGFVTLPASSRAEAVDLFLKAPTNLLAFCREQVHRESEPLIGGVDDYNASYVPALHVERPDVVVPQIARFLSGSDPGFVLVADAAMGKTCTMIEITNALLEKGVPTLFFRGAMLETDILNAINREVEWAAGQSAGDIETLHRLSSGTGNVPLVVVVDGIDDWGYHGKVQHLASLLAHLRPEKARLILSCKQDRWPDFLSLRGSRTMLDARIFQATGDQQFSFQLPRLSEREFSAAVKKCRMAFAGPGAFSEDAWNEAKRTPFLLRLLFQVASRTKSPFLTFTPDFFDAYLNLVFQKTTAPEVAARTVTAVADVLYEVNQEWVAESVVRKRLQLGINDTLMPDLFTQRILVSVEEAGQRRLSIGFAPLRNYVTAFRSRAWPRANAAEFSADVSSLPLSGPRAEVLRFYYPFATTEQKAVLDEPLRSNATRFVSLYAEVLSEHFAANRDRFAPFTVGRIGFVGEWSLAKQAIGFYGYRAIGKSDDLVTFVPEATISKLREPMLLDAEYLHWRASANGFNDLDVPREVLTAEIVPQLRKIIETGGLSDAATPAMAEEVIRSALLSHSSIFGRLLNRTRTEPSYPLSLDQVEEQFHRELFRRMFQDELVERRRASGEIQERWSGSSVSFSYSFSTEDRSQIESLIDSAIAAREQIPAVNESGLRKLWSRLHRAVVDRRVHGDVILDSLLPLRGPLSREKKPDYETFKEHCRQVMRLALESYRLCIEHNFPTLRDRFAFYQHLPRSTFIAVSPEMLADDSWGYCYFSSDSGPNDIVVHDRDSVRHDGETLKTPAGSFRAWGPYTASASSFIKGPSASRLELDEPGSVIRRWVYRWLQQDLNRVEKALLAEYELTESG